MAEREKKQCENCKSDFSIEPEDFDFYKKMGVLAPKLCPDCRLIRRMLWRNERSLYSRKCDLCGTSIVSQYSPTLPFRVYCLECYRSDKWDPEQYKMEYDPSRPFFDQFEDLMKIVPKASIYSDNLGVNTVYVNYAGYNKNCYLIFNSGHNEESLYSRGLAESREIIDGYFCNNAEKVYEGVNVQKSNGVMYGQNSINDIDSFLLLNTSGCQNCFGCVNLRNASHHFFNKPLSKEEYEERTKKIKGSYFATQKAIADFNEHSSSFPQRENANIKTVDSTGNYLFECKSTKECFESFDCEDCKYSHFLKHTKDTYDALGFGYGSELLLDTVAVGRESQRIIGSYGVSSSQNIFYSFYVKSSKDCFGCDGIKNGEYMILNKRYEKDEYERVKSRIIGELTVAGEFGLFFPPRFAPFAYNETIAQENFPLTKKEVEDAGYRWQDELQKTMGKETVLPENLPDHINDVPDSITEEILKCIECSRNYRIIPQELSFYRRMEIPLPRRCFNCRHLDRVRRRGPMKLFERECARCKKNIETSYSKDLARTVYCVACYQSEVV